MRVTVYVRINRKYRVATKKDTAPFFLRYKKDGKRIWQEAGVGYYNEAVALGKLSEGRVSGRGQAAKRRRRGARCETYQRKEQLEGAN